MTVRAIILDIGGVLELTPDTGVYQRWDEKFGAGSIERLGDLFEAGEVGHITLEQLHERAADTLEASVALFDAFMEEVWIDYLGTYNAEMADYWRARRTEGYVTAIISNSFVGAREREEEAYRFSELTDLIVYSHEVGLKKPDPAIYELCLERLGMRADEVVFVDDYEPNCVAARELGMAAVLFEDTEQTLRDLDALLQKG